ncbi:MAG: hypothetical protein J7518_05655 [Nocardioidaceae bacterium]|nr:hypothetical protein [Nocardioidaceae bacterium]
MSLPTAQADQLDIDISASVNIDLHLGTGGGGGGGGTGGLSQAFGGSATNLLQKILCPVVTTVADTTTNIPGVGPLVDALPPLVCSINVLGYVYRTTYVPPSGPPVVRYTKALAGVPTLIDVDGNGIPDFTGTLSPNLTLNGITLLIQRGLFYPAANKVSIEAIAINPAAPNSYVGFGPDGTPAGTAKQWQARLSVLGISSAGVDLGLDLKTHTPPSSLTTVGEMFSGANPDAPDTIYRGAANFSPVPATFSTRIKAAQSRQEFITTSTPSKLTAEVGVVTPGRRQKVDLTADQLPSSIDVVHTTGAGGQEKVTYDASAPIAKLTGKYEDKVGSAIATAAALDAWGIPTHLEFEQAGDKTSVGAGDGKIDRIQARFAKGSDVDALDPATTPFARYHRTTASKFTAALQVLDFKSASFNSSEPYGGDLQFATAPGLFPFTADDDTSTTHVEGYLSNLPARTTISADITNGKVTFDGHGTGIDKIFLKATRPTPFFTRVKRLEATLEHLPAEETIDVKQQNGAMSASASNPLGDITLLASDGSAAPAISGAAASYEDTPSLYRAFLRIGGLTSVSFQGDPVVADLVTAGAQFLTVKGATNGVTFDGTVDSLPAHLTFSLKPGAGGSTVVDFDSHGEAIATIQASGGGLTAPAGMPNFEARIEHLPSHLTLTLPQGTGNATFDAHGDHIGRVYAQAWGGSKAAVDATRQRLEFVDGQHVVANLLGIGNAEFGTGADPIHLSYDISNAPLDYKVVTGDIDLHGTISDPQPATIDINPLEVATEGQSGVTASYQVTPGLATGDGSIDEITLTGSIGNAYLDTSIKHIPASLDVCLATTIGPICKPSYVPATATGRTVFDPDFAMHFFPRNLAGNVPSTPVVVNGLVCPETSNAGNCADFGQNRVRIAIDNLSFKTVEAAFSSHDDGCDVACGRVWAAANTHGPGSPSEGDHLTGRVRYFDGDGDIFPDPKVDLNMPSPGGFLAFHNLFFFLHYDAIPPTADIATGGSFTCGDSPTPSLVYAINNLPDPDFLGGIFGVC